MTDTETPPDGQTIKAESLTVEKKGQTKPGKSQTGKVKWSIFTETETKASVVKAAKKGGLGLNEWIDRTLRQTATDELTKKAQPPAKPEDLVADIVKQVAEQMKADQAAAAQAQATLLERQGDQIAALTDIIKNQAPPPEPLT